MSMYIIIQTEFHTNLIGCICFYESDNSSSSPGIFEPKIKILSNHFLGIVKPL
jgi:hypothetical protein